MHEKWYQTGLKELQASSKPELAQAIAQALLGSNPEGVRSVYLAYLFGELTKIDVLERFQFQLEVYRAINQFLWNNGRQGAVILPTGSGKSEIQATIAATIANAGGKVLVVTSRINLVKDLTNRSNQKIEYENLNPTAGVVVIAYPTLLYGLKNHTIIPATFDLVLLDEVHRALSEVQRQATHKFLENGVPVLGFTATPQLLHTDVNQCGYQTLYKMSIPQAVEKGILCPLSVSHVYIRKSLADLSSVTTTSSSDYNQEKVSSLLSTDSFLTAVETVWTTYCRDQPTIIFAGTVALAERIAAKINEKSLETAVAVSGKMSSQDQEKIKKRLREPNDSLKVVVNAQLWEEGTDIPEVSRVLITTPTLSPRKGCQMMGRGTRYLDGKVLEVYEFHYEGVRAESVVNVLDGRSKVIPQSSDKDSTKPRDSRRTLPQNRFTDNDQFFIINNVEEMRRLGSLHNGEAVTDNLPPPGWMNITQITVLISKSPSYIQKKLTKLNAVGELFRSQSGETLYYPPEVINRIYEISNTYTEAPEGWKTVAWLANFLKISQDKANNLLTTSLDKFNLRACEYLSKTSQVCTFYPPEVIQSVILEFQSSQENLSPPPHLITINQMLKLDISGQVVKNALEQISERFADLRPQTYRHPSNGAQYSYYSPTTLDLVIELIYEGLTVEAIKQRKQENYQQPRIGWQTAGQVSLKNSMGAKHVRSFLETSAKKLNIPAVICSTTGTDYAHRYYHQDVIQDAIAQLKAIQLAPDEYVTSTGICDTLKQEYNIDQRKLKKILESICNARPELSPKLYKTFRGQLREHYPSQIIDLVIQAMNAR